MIKIILILIVYLFYKIGFIGKLIHICLPFLYGFVLAYIFNPIYIYLKKHLNSFLSILIIIFIILLVFILLIIFMPSIIKDITYLSKTIINYLIFISNKYNINIQDIVIKINEIMNYNYIIECISKSINYIYKIFLTLISFIYMLIDMPKIKESIYKINPKVSKYLNYIGSDFNKYIGSLIKISIITFFEYTFAFLLIGHKYALLVGFIAGILNMIPYLGGILTVFITILLEPAIIVKISITYLILGLIDGYLISPYIYGKYNKINPIIGLFAISFGSIFNITGIILSFPILIIIKSTIEYINKNKIDIKKIINL